MDRKCLWFKGDGLRILGAPKVAVLLAAMAAFLGYGVATASGTHLRPNLLDWVFPKRHDHRVNRLSDLVAAAAFFYFGWHAVEFVQSTYKWGDRAEVIYIYLWPIQTVIPYALISCGLRHLVYSIWPSLRPVPRTEGLEELSQKDGED